MWPGIAWPLSCAETFLRCTDYQCRPLDREVGGAISLAVPVYSQGGTQCAS